MKEENGEMAPDEDREAVENREAAGIARFQEAKSGNFWNDADSERKASRETFWRTLTRREKPFRRLPGGHPMKDENGDMAPDEDREAVEISRGSRNREIVTTESS